MTIFEQDLENVEKLMALVDKYKLDSVKYGVIEIHKSKHDFKQEVIVPNVDMSKIGEVSDEDLFYSSNV